MVAELLAKRRRRERQTPRHGKLAGNEKPGPEIAEREAGRV